MHPIQFGFCVPVFAAPGGRLFRTPNYAQLDTGTTMALARTADQLGYDSLWVADHLMLGQDEAILEGWTVLAALAGSTQQARLGLIHQAHFFRNPALAAKMVATLDQISGGRFIYFTDPAHGEAEHRAYGLPWPEPVEERIERTVEGLEVALALWQAQAPVEFRGDYYQLADAVCNPKPVQQPHPPVWFGEAHPLTLQACARYGQGWNTVPVTRTELRRRLQKLAAACTEVERSFEALEKSLETQILVAPDQATLRQRLAAMIELAPPARMDPELQAFLDGRADEVPASLTSTWIIGTPEAVAQQVQDYINLGITHFLLWFMDAPRQEGLRLFAEQVAPRFRG